MAGRMVEIEPLKRRLNALNLPKAQPNLAAGPRTKAPTHLRPEGALHARIRTFRPSGVINALTICATFGLFTPLQNPQPHIL